MNKLSRLLVTIGVFLTMFALPLSVFAEGETVQRPVYLKYVLFGVGIVICILAYWRVKVLDRRNKEKQEKLLEENKKDQQ